MTIAEKWTLNTDFVVKVISCSELRNRRSSSLTWSSLAVSGPLRCGTARRHVNLSCYVNVCGMLRRKRHKRPAIASAVNELRLKLPRAKRISITVCMYCILRARGSSLL